MLASFLDQFQQVGRMLWESGLVSSHGGNMSVRLEDQAMLITRHACLLGRIGDGDLVQIDRQGLADGEPSLDTAIHRAIYAAQSQAGAVIHAHPCHAVALSLRQSVIEPLDLEGQHYLQSVEVVEAEGVPQALKERTTVVVRGHGSYAWGNDLWQALQWTSVLEESAQVLWLLRALP